MRFLQKVERRSRWEISRCRLWLNDIFYTRWQDVLERRRLTPFHGAVQARNKIAVYAVFPKLGVQRSHLRALQHLAECGYAPLVVSNLPLIPAQKEQLRPLSWCVIERANFGFDIGGYRAAISWLGPRLQSLDRLVFTNDSIWFPFGEGRDWLHVAEGLAKAPAAPALIGAVTNGTPRVDTDGWWQLDRAEPDFHYCSFALSIGPAILRDPEFVLFWKRMRLTRRKVPMVERGEVALSRWIIGRGHSHTACWDPERLQQLLATLEPQRLQELIGMLIIPEDAELRARRDAFLYSPEAFDPQPARKFLTEVTMRTGVAYALPALTLDQDGIGFLKKSPLRLDPAGADATLKLVGVDPHLLEEARSIALLERRY